jgi:hypothetical protein
MTVPQYLQTYPLTPDVTRRVYASWLEKGISRRDMITLLGQAEGTLSADWKLDVYRLYI